MTTIIAIAVFIFGTIIGSFLNVIIWRMPKEQTLGGRSRCPKCDHSLSALELVPLFSFLIQQGKCRHCKVRISPRYFIIELSTGLLFAATFIILGPATLFQYTLLARALFITSILIVVFVIDFEHYLILDRIILPSSLALIAINFLLDLWQRQPVLNLYSLSLGGIFGAIIFSGFFFILHSFSRGRWMGFGDVKLAIFLGLAVGWPRIVITFLTSFFLGALVSLILISLGKKNMSSVIPFGTFLSAAALVSLLYGKPLFDWYAALVLGAY